MVTELASCFDRTVVLIRELVADLSDEEMVMQRPGVPNHAAWTLGHIIYSCQAIAGELGVRPWLPADWELHFAQGSLPDGAISQHWRKPALLAALTDATDRLRAALLATDQNTLASPLPDEKMREMLPTVGHALVQIVAAHTAFHAGQLAAWRRAIGRAPVGVFI